MSGCNKRPVHIKQPLKMTKKYAKIHHDMGFSMKNCKDFLGTVEIGIFFLKLLEITTTLTKENHSNNKNTN